jgi:hypothetical protein
MGLLRGETTSFLTTEKPSHERDLVPFDSIQVRVLEKTVETRVIGGLWVKFLDNFLYKLR